jgi:hypothetical protein
LFFEEYLGSKGFKFLRSKDEYVKKEDDWSFTYFFVYTGWSKSVSIHIDLLISYKKTNVIFKKLFGYDNYLINAELGCVSFLSDDGRSASSPQSIDKYVHSIEEAKVSIQEFKALLEGLGDPFFKKYSNLETVYSLLCDPPYKHSFITMTYFDRVANSIILESQLQNGRINTLVKEYTEEIASIDNDRIKVNFKRLLEYFNLKYPTSAELSSPLARKFPH